MALQVRGESSRNTDDQNRARLAVRPDRPRRGAKVFRKGPWTTSETEILSNYISQHGPQNWSDIHRYSMLRRNGKSCRLRWANHLRPNLRKCPFSVEEERRIIELHFQIGNKWTQIASVLEGRTDNDVKNFWNTRLKKCKREGLPIYPLDIQPNECPNSSTTRIHQSPYVGIPLVPTLDSFPRAQWDMPSCSQVLPAPYFTHGPLNWNAASFDGGDSSQIDTPSLQEKGMRVDDWGQMEDPNVLNLTTDFTNMHLDISSSDNSSYQKMSAHTDSFEGMTMTVIDDELAALLDFSIPAPTLDDW